MAGLALATMILATFAIDGDTTRAESESAMSGPATCASVVPMALRDDRSGASLRPRPLVRAQPNTPRRTQRSRAGPCYRLAAG